MTVYNTEIVPCEPTEKEPATINIEIQNNGFEYDLSNFPFDKIELFASFDEYDENESNETLLLKKDHCSAISIVEKDEHIYVIVYVFHIPVIHLSEKKQIKYFIAFSRDEGVTEEKNHYFLSSNDDKQYYLDALFSKSMSDRMAFEKL